MERNRKILFLRIIFAALLVFVAMLAFNFFPFLVKFKMLIYIVPYLVVGYDVILRTCKNIVKLKFLDENALMFIATVGAFFLKEYLEAVFVFLLYQVGELFQNFAIASSENNIKDIMAIRPNYANLKQKGTLNRVNPEVVNVGDVIVIKPGEKIPLDGVILSGGSYIDMSAMTGESNHLNVGPGDRVLSGSLNVGGVLEVCVEKKYKDSAVSKVLSLMENINNKKSKTENLIRKFAKIYTPCVVAIGVLIFVVPVMFFNGVWEVWLEKFLIFLVISCPCALVISVPVSFFLAISKAAKNGILVKGGIFLEQLFNVNTVIFDKTGTLTTGDFFVSKISNENFSKEEILEVVALVEVNLNHPIAKSIKKAYNKELDIGRVKNIEDIFGKGVKAFVDGREVFVGNLKLMNSIGIYSCKDFELGTTVHVAINGKYAGYIALQDKIKENVKSVIKKLKQNGIEKTVMLTGDRKAVGEHVASKINLDCAFCELLPHNKVEKLEYFLCENSSNGKKVAFVGDGINDAAVLKRADVGLAMGAIGSDAAMQACDIVLMDDDIKKVLIAILISKKVVRTVKQNIFFSLSFKAVIFLLGVFGLTNVWLAIFSDVGVSILAILNAFIAFRGRFYLK